MDGIEAFYDSSIRSLSSLDGVNISNHIEGLVTLSDALHAGVTIPIDLVGYSWENQIQYITPSVCA